jgi:hypothetical protein
MEIKMWQHDVSCMTYGMIEFYLNEMGKKGWELVSLIRRLEAGEYMIIMKKPL